MSLWGGFRVRTFRRPRRDPASIEPRSEELEAYLTHLEAEAKEVLATRPRRWYLVLDLPEPYVGFETCNPMMADVFQATLGSPDTHVLDREDLLLEGGPYLSALEAWEARDDHVYEEVRRRWARSIPGFVADRRAKLKWGLLPASEDLR